jgi:hypothetical protein
MSASDMPKGNQGRPTKRVSPRDPVRSAKPAITKPLSLQGPSHPMAMAIWFSITKPFSQDLDWAKGFSRLKKNETAFVQGDRANAIFHVQRGKLKVTVASANGKKSRSPWLVNCNSWGRIAWFPLILFDSRRLRQLPNVSCSRSVRLKWFAYFMANQSCRTCSSTFCLPLTPAYRPTLVG